MSHEIQPMTKHEAYAILIRFIDHHRQHAKTYFRNEPNKNENLARCDEAERALVVLMGNQPSLFDLIFGPTPY